MQLEREETQEILRKLPIREGGIAPDYEAQPVGDVSEYEDTALDDKPGVIDQPQEPREVPAEEPETESDSEPDDGAIEWSESEAEQPQKERTKRIHPFSSFSMVFSIAAYTYNMSSTRSLISLIQRRRSESRIAMINKSGGRSR